MPFIAAIGTYLPCWGCDVRRIVGDDEDAITLAVEAGRAALRGGGAAAIVDERRLQVRTAARVARSLPVPTTGASAGLFALSYLAEADIPISLAAYERAFESKTPWEAGKFANSDQVDFPPVSTVYTSVAVHLPVPGLRTPYALAKVTGADPDSIDHGDRGHLVLRGVAMRSGVPDYGYAFQPEPVVRAA